MAKSDRAHLRIMWDFLPPKIQKALERSIEDQPSSEEGAHDPEAKQCPRCGGSRTIDCNGVKGIADPTVGLCVACGYLWCLECETHLISTVTCGHWKICANCTESKDEAGYCRTLPRECKHIGIWLDRNNPRA